MIKETSLWSYLLGLIYRRVDFPTLSGRSIVWWQFLLQWMLECKIQIGACILVFYFFSFGNIVCWLFKTAKLCWLEIGQGMRSYGDVGLLIKSSIYSSYKNLLYFLFLIQIRLGLTYKSFFEISFFLVSKESL